MSAATWMKLQDKMLSQTQKATPHGIPFLCNVQNRKCAEAESR